MVDEFSRNFDRLTEQERRLGAEVDSLIANARTNGGRIPGTDLNRAIGERDTALETLRSLSDQTQSIEQQTLQENDDLSTGMRNLRNAIDRMELERQMQLDRRYMQNGYLLHSQELERGIREGLDALREQIDTLGGGLPVTEEEKLNRSVRDTRDMLQRYRDILAQQETGARQQPGPQDGQPDEQAALNAAPGQDPSRDDPGGQAGGQQARTGQPGTLQNGPEEPRQAGAGGSGRNGAAQMRRLSERFDELLDRMERDFPEYTDLRQAIETARRRSAPPITGELLGEDAGDHFQAMFEPLSQIEQALLNRLSELEAGKKLYTSRKSDIPPQYEPMVDRYFESIARERGE
jgi:hypothetical protein